ncbi:hypothetical protein CEXT_298101 [Caerostris extrusa]|uniref:Uncharacterized protein n=1 Tax=Caerostris extrusa TaxID=172846 RepID=A0AAV4XQR0_CAEEX|nr:hypothetical protein CEXT_298101 [Caerostris extrusa]
MVLAWNQCLYSCVVRLGTKKAAVQISKHEEAMETFLVVDVELFCNKTITIVDVHRSDCIRDKTIVIVDSALISYLFKSRVIDM